jgi:hypothetical protein
MWKWIKRGLLIFILGYVGWGAFDYYRAGYHTLPPMPEGAFPLSYANGLRAIMVGLPDETDSRRYFGYPLEVPFYLQEAWATCKAPTEVEIGEIEAQKPNRPGERIEAVCRIEVDGDIVVRGFITTVPKL